MNQTLLQNWQDSSWPTIKSSKAPDTGDGVIDPRTFNTIEVDELFDAVNHASTIAGQAVLYRSLAQPLNDLEQIKAKQQAVEELRNNPALKEQLEQIVHTLFPMKKTSIYCCSANFWEASAQPGKSMKLKATAICNINAASDLCWNWSTAFNLSKPRKASIYKAFATKSKPLQNRGLIR